MKPLPPGAVRVPARLVKPAATAAAPTQPPTPQPVPFSLVGDEFADLRHGRDKDSDPVRLAQEFLSGTNIFGKTFITHKQAKLFMLLSVLDRRHPQDGWDRVPTIWSHLMTGVAGRGRTGVLEMLKGNVDVAPPPPPPEPISIR